MATKAKDTRTRNWVTEFYPESAPENWFDIIRDFHVPTLISPVHDKDIYDHDHPEGKFKKGDLKKPHHHVMFLFNGNKSYEQISELTSAFNGVGLEACKSVQSYARYLCHLDDPDKALYDIFDVSSLGGIDYLEIISLPSEKYAHIREIMEFCMQNQVYSFADLSLYAMMHRRDWFRILVDKNTLFIKEFLKARAWDVFENTKIPRRIDDNGDLIQ